MPPEPSTHASLLARLRLAPTDQIAWSEFVDRYAPTIFTWCRSRGLQEADAQDVMQTVLAILARRMKTFSYDPQEHFRNWLRTVTRHAWSAFVEARQRSPGTGAGNSLETLEAREDLVARLERRFDLELLELAFANVRSRVAPHTWEAFHLTAVEQESPANVAARLGMKIATVYVARSKVQQMIRAEVQRQEDLEASSAQSGR